MSAKLEEKYPAHGQFFEYRKNLTHMLVEDGRDGLPRGSVSHLN